MKTGRFFSHYMAQWRPSQDGVSGINGEIRLSCSKRWQGVGMRFVLLLILSCFFAVPVIPAATIEQQRDWFTEAHRALDAHHMDRYATLKKRLADYPLAPYLDIWEQRKTINGKNDADIAATLALFPDIPESDDLRKAWVKSLAERSKWKEVAHQLEQHPRLKAKLAEMAIVAEWHSGNKELAMTEFSKRWVNLDKFSGTSISLHKAWLRQGHPSSEERWSRIIKLAGKGHWRDVEALDGPISKQQKKWLHYWRNLQKNPQSVFSRWPDSLSPSTPMYTALCQAIINDGLTRLARKDPVQAYAMLQNLTTRMSFGNNDGFYDEVGKEIALRAARQHLTVAAGWLQQLPLPQQNAETRAWQARMYMLEYDWARLLQCIEMMPAEEQQEDRWQYWRGYALQARGDHEKATAVFSAVANGRGYYSFLSAERMGLPYSFDNEQISASPTIIRELEQRSGLTRAREWLALKSYNKADREWYTALATASTEEWKAAAVIASAWQWPEQAIRAAYRGGAMNALEERFPLHYQKDVLLAAKETGLSSASIWGVIRQESLFNRQALSPAGARGLMQLMPKTAKMVAKKIRLHGGHEALFSPRVNIRLGSHYLAAMKARFHDQLALAAAAYNAGPHRVKQWLERTPFDTGEIWVETIPFNETRHYVQQVMANATVYEWRQQQTPTRKFPVQAIVEPSQITLNSPDLL